jgi:thiol-disulfide isomerase/thioredoxin
VRALTMVALAGSSAPAVAPRATLSAVPVYAADARPTDLAALAGGRPLVLDFFATWCDGCRDNLAPMNELARVHAGEIVVAGIDVGEDRAVAARFIAREGIGYPVYTDPEMRFEDSLGVTALPLVLVVDKNGRIVHRAARLDDETLRVIQDLAPRTAEAR